MSFGYIYKFRTVLFTRTKLCILMKQVKQTLTQGERKLILSTSESEPKEHLKRSKQKKTEEKGNKRRKRR